MAQCALAVVLALWTGVAAAGVGATDRVQGELGQRLHAYLETLERLGMHGSIGVEYRGTVILAAGYGKASHDPVRPATPETLYHIGSLSKQFTATTVLRLAEQEILRLEDPIGIHLPDLPPDKQAITVHQLLTHTAGLPYLPGQGSPAELALQSRPGHTYAYSNPGYTLLAQVVEAAAGQPFEAVVRAQVLTPAGLEHTRFLGTAHWPEDVASAYTDSTDQGSVRLWAANPRYRGAGNLVSSVTDLLTWERALREGTILSPLSSRRLISEHVRNPDTSHGYAYGWMTTTTPRGSRLVFHQGNLGGFNSDYRRYLDEDLTIVFLSNHFVTGRSMRDAVVNNVSKIINGGEPMALPELATPETTTAIELGGDYVFSDGRTISASVVDERLFLSAGDQESLLLLYGSSHDTEVRSFADACNERTEVMLHNAVRGDPTVLRAEISRSLPFDGAWATVRGMMEEWRTIFGAYRDCTVLGTAPGGGTSNGVTVALVRFERGEDLVQVTWSRNGIIHITRAPFFPAREFHPLRNGALVAFDLFTGRSTHVDVRRSDAGVSLVFRVAGAAEIAHAVQ